MNLKIQNKQIIPSVINLRQFATTDTLVFELDNYIYEEHDLSQLNCYALADMGNDRLEDKAMLETEIVDGKLRITWRVTGYTTQKDGHVTYVIMFSNNEENPPIWRSYQALIIVNSSLNVDDWIAVNYPSILQQWEERMKTTHEEVTVNMEEIREAVRISVENATQTGLDASSAGNSATSANKAWIAIQELLGYQPVDAIGMEVMQARGEYDLLGDRLDAIEAQASSGQTVIKNQIFTATEDQQTFVLDNPYTLGGNHLTIAVNGMLQTQESIVEVDENTVQLLVDIDAGDIVDITYHYVIASANLETPSGAQKKVDALKLYTDGLLAQKALKPIVKKVTLYASNWSGNTNTLAFAEVTANSIQHVSVDSTATQEQAEAFNSASIMDGGQSAGNMILKALGDIPTVNIPITVTIEVI